MSPVDQCRAIAEAVGFSDFEEGPNPRAHTGMLALFGKLDGKFMMVPFFTSDLNAMHEAEKKLTDEQRIAYVMAAIDNPDGFGGIFATAAQRSEAFLRTTRQWVDAPTTPASGEV